jgi:hypothetical protein
VLCLEIVVQLVQPNRIDSGSKSGPKGLEPKGLARTRGALLGREPAADHLVDGGLEGDLAASGELLQPFRHVIVKGKRRAREDIMMPFMIDVKMP